MTRRFKYSSERIKQQKTSSILMGGIIPAVLPVYVFIADQEMATEIGVGGMLILSVLFGIVSAASFAIVTAMAAKRWKELEVRLLDDKIERQLGKAIDGITYESVKQVVVGKHRSGKPVYVRMYTPTSAMYLSGLSQMDKVVHLISQRVSATVEMKEKRIWFDWSNPTTILVFGLPTMLIVGLVCGLAERLGRNISDTLTGVLVFATGLWFLIFRPVSRGGSFQYKGYETVLGILAILLCVLFVATVWLY